MAIAGELQFDFGIEVGLQESEKADIVSQCLDQSSSRFALRIRPSSKRSEGGNIIGNAMVLSTPSKSFPTESHPGPRLVDVPIP